MESTGFDAAAAVDDAGVATIAFSRTHPVAGVEAPGPATLFAARALPGRRFGAPASVRASAGAPATAAGFSTISIAAAGTTTAPASADATTARAVGVSIARGGRGFDAVQRPSALPAAGFGAPMDPVPAVDPADDVLLAYHYGHEGLLGYIGESVHVAERRAHESRFSAPRLLSTLGHGGPPAVALRSDGAPLVVFADRRLHLRTAIAGHPLDLTAPRATVTPARDAGARLLAHAALGARISCSEPCIVETLASLRTKTGRAITTDRAILRARAPSREASRSTLAAVPGPLAAARACG